MLDETLRQIVAVNQNLLTLPSELLPYAIAWASAFEGPPERSLK